MKILAFEASAKACSVAIWQDGQLLAESYQNTGLTHSQTLMVMAEDMIKTCDLTPEDIDAVAVAAGPGSFTGVRIGVAAAKGFAWGRQIPCCGVSTLEAMAENLGVYEGYALAAMDARRNQVYTALFKAKKGTLTPVISDCACSLEELAEKLSHKRGNIYLVGDGAQLVYRTLQEKLPKLVLPAPQHLHQRAAGVAKVAEKMLQQGVSCDAAALKPNYLRLSQAERERLERQKTE